MVVLFVSLYIPSILGLGGIEAFSRTIMMFPCKPSLNPIGIMDSKEVGARV